MKQCRRCNEWKPPEAFYRRSDALDKLGSYCKACCSEYAREHNCQRRLARSAQEQERLREYARNYYRTHREAIRASRRAYELSYTKQRQEQRRAYQRRYYQSGAGREAIRRYYKRHREAVRFRYRVRRARQRSRGSFTHAEWQALCAQYENRCLACGCEGSLTVDHVVPLVKGGSNDISNIQPLCHSCNASKGTRIIDYRQV